MSNNQIVIDTLLKKRESLQIERNAMYLKYNEEIREITEAIEQLTGKPFGEHASPTLYDDENPDYIKGTEDGI